MLATVYIENECSSFLRLYRRRFTFWIWSTCKLDRLKRCIIASGSFYAAVVISYTYLLCVCIDRMERNVITLSNCDEDVPYRSFSQIAI